MLQYVYLIHELLRLWKNLLAFKFYGVFKDIKFFSILRGSKMKYGVSSISYNLI